MPDEFQSSGGAINLWLRGPSSSDFDLYLFKRESSGWVQVASSLKSVSEEQVSYQAAAGSYRVQVKSYSGSGSFELWRK